MDTATVETMASFATSGCDATEIDPTLVTIVKRVPVAPLPPAFGKAPPAAGRPAAGKPAAPASVAPPSLAPPSLSDPNDMPTAMRPVPDELLAGAVAPIAERLAVARSDYPRYDPAAMRLPPPLPPRKEQKPVDDAAAFAVQVMSEALSDAAAAPGGASLASLLEPEETAPPSLPLRERLRMFIDDVQEALVRARPFAAPVVAFARRWAPYALAGAVVGLVVAVAITKVRDAFGTSPAAAAHDAPAAARESLPAARAAQPAASPSPSPSPSPARMAALAAVPPPEPATPMLRLPAVMNPTPSPPAAAKATSVVAHERHATASVRTAVDRGDRADHAERPERGARVAAAPAPAARAPHNELAPMPTEYLQGAH